MFTVDTVVSHDADTFRAQLRDLIKMYVNCAVSVHQCPPNELLARLEGFERVSAELHRIIDRAVPSVGPDNERS